jgi:FtsP/CotA-like multicopper oxidase with cupredoxin domain
VRTGFLLKLLGAAAGVLVAAAVAWVAYAWYDSRLPATYNVMEYGRLDYGGGPVPDGASSSHGAHTGAILVSGLRASAAGPPDARFTLTAQRARIRLPSGRVLDALTFDGRVPGPELRVRQGDLVEVTLRNRDIPSGVTIHWHGVDVPNAEDGVAGVTQDAVMPGSSYTYRFRADQVGTFWYHTHQASSDEVRRGLFGAFVIEPTDAAAREALDLALVAHDFDGVQTLNGRDGVQRRRVEAGTGVRLRLVNSDNTPRRFALVGTPFRVVAIDGTDLHEPGPIRARTLVIAAGGRYDLAFAMPSTPVELSVAEGDPALALSGDGRGRLLSPVPTRTFDPFGYGRPTETPFDAASSFDREFELRIGRKPGFLDGKPGYHWSLNGGIYPDVPTFVVEEGDLVKMTVENASGRVHPMHLHGHHLLVLSRDGRPATGSPWWVDTLDVRDGERYELAFRADNPGLWMDHCHNLGHAAAGLTMHLAYAVVSTPFLVGGHSHNRPE